MRNPYVCDFCKTSIPWGGSNDVKGEIWGCERCGKTFCDQCFVDEFGENERMRMFQRDEGIILCPDCWEEEREDQ